MNFEVAKDARPQVQTLLIVTLISVALWFIPFADYLVYPIRLFVTFIHEGGHALAAVLTGSAVYSLTVFPNTSGVVMAGTTNTLASLIVSSAGYVGAAAYGAVLLIMIRQAIAARYVLAASGVWIAILTFFFGLIVPMWNAGNSATNLSGIPFTLASGSILALGLFALAKYGSQFWAQFALAFLAVQCVLNALTDLKTVFFISAMSNQHNDALNMYNATGVPSMFWILTWIFVSLALLGIALRIYGVRKNTPIQSDLPFED